MPSAHQGALSLPSSAGQGRVENKMEKIHMGQDKVRLVKQK